MYFSENAISMFCLAVHVVIGPVVQSDYAILTLYHMYMPLYIA